MKKRENEILRLFTQAVHRLTIQVETFAFEDKKLGQGIFIIDYIDQQGPCSMTDVVKAMNMIPSTATRQVDRLVNWGLVAREPSKMDRRRVILSVTASGTQASKKFVKHRMKNLRPILRSMSEKETEVLAKLLERVVERL
jgi:DNA-binding MarR family transcriptional regulator